MSQNYTILTENSGQILKVFERFKASYLLYWKCV